MTSSGRSRFPSPQSRRQSSHRPRFARNWRGFALGVAALTVTTALLAQDSIVTNASWTDEEWVHGQVGTTDCSAPEGDFTSRGEGRVLSGSLLNIDLDNIAEAKGVDVINDGTGSTRDPLSAVELGDDAYSNPLNVEALNTADVNLTGLLELPLGTETGVLGQYGQAKNDATSVGASGTVTDDGGISLEQYEGDVPDLAELKLSTLLGSLGLGGLLQDITDLQLSIGAVGGRAWLDGCRDAWNLPDEVTRDYLTSHVNLELTSPTVGALGGVVSDTASTLESTANGLVGNDSLLSGVLGGVINTVVSLVGLLTSLLGIRIGQGGQTATIEALTLNLQPVRDLLETPIGDEVVSITLAAGTTDAGAPEGLVVIDTVALLGAVDSSTYSNGLNELAPNTNPLADPAVLQELSVRLGSVITSVVAQLQAALLNTVQQAEVVVQLSIPVTRCSLLGLGNLCIGSWVELGAIGVTISGSIGELLANEGTINVDLSVLSALGLLGTAIAGLGEDLVAALIADGLLPTVGGLIAGVLTPVATLPSTLFDDLGTPIVSLVSGLYNNLFLDEVVALTINAQNLTPTTDDVEPPEWSNNPHGPYEVSAIRVGILDALGASAVYLHLGRASVGPGCSINSDAVWCPSLPTAIP